MDELRDATGWPDGDTSTSSDAGSVAYLAPEAPEFCEAGELKGEVLASAQRILDERGMSGGNAG